MRRALLFALPAVALAIGAPGVAGALTGDAPAKVAWWSQDPTAAEQPDGGFQVAATAGQAVSVAAVAFDVPDGATSATLNLQEAEGAVVSPATALQVCPTTDGWQPANPGAYDEAPEPDCTSPIELTRDEAELTWSADVPAALATSLMIVPGEAAAGGSPVDPGFQVTFTGAALDVVAPVSTGGGATTPTTTFSSPSSPSSPSFGTSGRSTFTPPSPASVSPPAATATATTVADTTVTTVAVEEGEAFQPFESDGSGRGGAEQPWGRLLLLVPMSALAGVAVVYGQRVLRDRGVLEEA